MSNLLAGHTRPTVMPWKTNPPKIAAPIVDPIKAAIDELAKVRADMTPLEKREKELKTILDALPIGDTSGNKCIAVVSVASRESLDTKAMKEDLPDVCARYARSTEVRTIRIKALV